MSLASKCNMQYSFLFFLPDNGITLATFRSYSCIIWLGSCDIYVVQGFIHVMSWQEVLYPYMAKVGGHLKYYSDAIAKILKDWHWYIFFQCDDDCQLLLPRNSCVTFGDKTSIGTLQFLCRFFHFLKNNSSVSFGKQAYRAVCVTLVSI